MANFAQFLAFVSFTILIQCEMKSCANILHISTTASRSHHIWESALALELSNRGYNVTYVTTAQDDPSENYTPIILEGVVEKMTSKYYLGDLINVNAHEQIHFLYDWLDDNCKFSLESKGLKFLLKQLDTIKYDVILFDITSGQCLYPLVERLKSPMIATSPFGLLSYLTSSFGTELNIAYNPFHFLPYTNRMSFLERINNFMHTLHIVYWRKYNYIPRQQKLADEYFGSDYSRLTEIEKRFELVLSNSDPIFDYPQSVPPNLIHVAGLHAQRVKPLPKDLQKYLDDSKNGVIIFSLGTNVRSDQMGDENIKSFLQVFSQRKENVIWKLESEFENIPKNVLARKWIPQNDLMAHPNVKLLITHCGALSVQEAMYHGVPVIGIPFLADQFVNMQKMVHKKLGLKMDYQNITTNYVMETINEVIDNPIYRNNLKLLSAKYHDQPQSALDRAVFWIEYVIKYGSAIDLRPAGADLSIIQLYFLDMWAILILIILIIFSFIKELMKGKQKMTIIIILLAIIFYYAYNMWKSKYIKVK